MKPFDPMKPVQQRCGRAARIICTDKDGSCSDTIVALTREESGKELERSYKASGKYYHHGICEHDLINIPETKKIKFWVNVYEEHFEWFKSHAVAKSCATSGVFACIEIEREVKEGEGL